MAGLPVVDDREDCTHAPLGRPCFVNGDEDSNTLHDKDARCKPVEL